MTSAHLLIDAANTARIGQRQSWCNASYPGFVYAITNPAWPDRIKLGRTRNHPKSRLSDFQVGDPNAAYRIVCASRVAYVNTVEGLIHRAFGATHHRGEWFSAPSAEVAAAFETLGIPCDAEFLSL